MSTPRPDELAYVNKHTRIVVRAVKPRLSKFWGYVAPPASTTAPVASGTGTVGSTLNVTNGVWSGAPTSYAYQWLRNGSSIAGATANSYVLAAGDATASVACRVTATNAGGSASAASNAIGVTFF